MLGFWPLNFFQHQLAHRKIAGGMQRFRAGVEFADAAFSLGGAPPNLSRAPLEPTAAGFAACFFFAIALTPTSIPTTTTSTASPPMTANATMNDRDTGSDWMGCVAVICERPDMLDMLDACDTAEMFETDEWV